MQKLGLNNIREEYLTFFEKKDHLKLPSYSLVPENDPSILLINAGMTPLKQYFTGDVKPPKNRITTCQKCMRTPDIDRVGITSRHGTFFEMLGNFSFGDYFKKEAITWAWEFITEVMKIPEEKLWVSIYIDDDEAFEIWNKDIGLSPERIVRLGKEDNFWEHGTGPCGPSSEIHFDRGIEKSCGKSDCSVGCDCDRYMEIWNLVFTQFNKTKEGKYELLSKKNIDTGMGLERLAIIMQGVDSLFEVDTLRNILDHVCSLANYKYGEINKKDISVRVITDHIRSTIFMVSDGVIPSNEGRGYVLRRILRRAARHGKLLGIRKQLLSEIAEKAIDESKEAYPELEAKKNYILKVISIEEERFYKTLDQGLEILNDFIKDLETTGKKILTGDRVFKLHDTYGFPVDLTREIAAECSLEIDENGFKEEMDNQKKMARDALKKKGGSAWSENIFVDLQNVIDTKFTGYEKLEASGKVLYILSDDSFVDFIQEKEEGIIITDNTPFYAESGGQEGDTGIIKTDNGEFIVNNTIKSPDSKFYLHKGFVKRGLIEKGNDVNLLVNSDKRLSIARNHTVTHLLHSALRKVLGGHVNQAGSYVGTDRLRFDFTHFNGLTVEEISRIENIINENIFIGIDVEVQVGKTIDDAKGMGATALFGEKYGDEVRIVKIGEASIELCGGTHLDNTSKAGFIIILSETGIAAGTRRIEAQTGLRAIEYFKEKENILNKVSKLLKVEPGDIERRVNVLIKENKKKDKEISDLKNKLVGDELEIILNDSVDIHGIKIITGRFDDLDMNGLRDTADKLKDKAISAVIVLASGANDKVSLIVSASKDVLSKGIHAGNIVREVAKMTGGSGGGRPDMAQAGGKDVSKIDEALSFAKIHISEILGK